MSVEGLFVVLCLMQDCLMRPSYPASATVGHLA